MCGIFGVARGKNISVRDAAPLNNFMMDACHVGTRRGEDSTGVFQVRTTSVVDVFKMPYPGEVFAKENRAEYLLRMCDTHPFTIGHHRAATVGNISWKNCHPFDHSDTKRYVVGVHNGRISNANYKQDNLNFSVDSDNAIYNIFKHGGPKALGAMEGDYAFVWYENDGKLRIASNHKRTIHWAYAADKDMMLIASEHGMLYWLAERNGIDIEENIWFPVKDKIYIFDPEDLRNYEMVDLEKPAKKPHYRAGDKWNAQTGVWEHTSGAKNHGPIGPHEAIRLGDEQEGDYDDNPLALTGVTPNLGLNANEREVLGLLSLTVPRTTWQNRAISHMPSDINRVGFEAGQLVDFFPSQKDKFKFVPSHTLIGEILRDEKDAAPEWAVILGLTAEMRENIEDAGWNNGDIEAKVIGVTEFIVEGHPQLCLVLGKPKKVSWGDSTLFSTVIETADDEDTPIDDDAEEDESRNVLVKHIPGPDGYLISTPEFQQLVQHGCSGCTASLTPDDAKNGNIHWTNGDVARQPLCVMCAEFYADMTTGGIDKNDMHALGGN